jgi:hypothetical protein
MRNPIQTMVNEAIPDDLPLDMLDKLEAEIKADAEELEKPRKGNKEKGKRWPKEDRAEYDKVAELMLERIQVTRALKSRQRPQ